MTLQEREKRTEKVEEHLDISNTTNKNFCYDLNMDTSKLISQKLRKVLMEEILDNEWWLRTVRL